MTADDLRARPNAVTTNGVRLGWIAITEVERDALADLIDAAESVLENGEPPCSWPVYAAREMRSALAALDQEATA